jgi:lysozyme
VAGDGISAAYIKASEGGTWKDSHFADNWDGASAAGLRVGAYHFFTLCREGAEQAANFLGMLDLVGAASTQQTLVPVVDLELGGNCSERPSKEVVIGRLEAFVEKVERETGQRAMFYVLDNFESLYPLPPHLDRPRWERRLALRPDGDWDCWQVNNRASVDGIEGPVDLNVLPAGAG